MTLSQFLHPYPAHLFVMLVGAMTIISVLFVVSALTGDLLARKHKHAVVWCALGFGVLVIGLYAAPLYGAFARYWGTAMPLLALVGIIYGHRGARSGEVLHR